MLIEAFIAAVPGADATQARLVAIDLLRRWDEPHRHYHTSRHLEAVLAMVDGFQTLAADAELVRLAAWYHDAIYDPAASDNEERSADLAAVQLTSLGLCADQVAEVARLVRLTRTHRPADMDANGALLCDADLAILASPADEYARYAHAVRAEYAHVPDDAFRAGRSAILLDLLDSPALFHTTPLRHRFEATAHANLRRELAKLTEIQ